MSDSVKAPFSDEQVAAINRYQKSENVHPFTCECGEILIATNEGLICNSCDYTQNWVHDFMAEWEGEFRPLYVELERDGISLQRKGSNIKAVFNPSDSGGCQVFFLVDDEKGRQKPVSLVELSEEGKIIGTFNYDYNTRTYYDTPSEAESNRKRGERIYYRTGKGWFLITPKRRDPFSLF